MAKRGQAALEFLTTYGWAFLIILVMIGAFAYFDILNPQRLFPGKCQFQVGITCDQYKIANPGGVAAGDNPYAQFQMKNQKGGAIYVSNLEYYNPNTGDYENCLAGSGLGTEGSITQVLDDTTGTDIAGERRFDMTCVFDDTHVDAVVGDKATLKVRYWYNEGATEDTDYQKPMQGSIVADVTEN